MQTRSLAISRRRFPATTHRSASCLCTSASIGRSRTTPRLTGARHRSDSPRPSLYGDRWAGVASIVQPHRVERIRHGGRRRRPERGRRDYAPRAEQRSRGLDDGRSRRRVDSFSGREHAGLDGPRSEPTRRLLGGDCFERRRSANHLDPQQPGLRALTATSTPPAAQRATTGSQALFDGATTNAWRIEHDANSVGAVELAESGETGKELRYRFGLAGGSAVGQFAALVYDLPAGTGDYDRFAFALRAEHPMRLSIQVRDTTADRWQKSIYVDESPRERVVALDDLIPVGVTHSHGPNVRPSERFWWWSIR